jgi:hypothetical protein
MSVASVALCSAWDVWCTGGLWVLWVLESLGVSWESGAENGSLLMFELAQMAQNTLRSFEISPTCWTSVIL